MSRGFYERFERHDRGEGLKGHATHYCPGCGHGVVQKFLAAALVDLGLQDRAVVISPVGCTVIMYYYLDTGNTQAAHGRAPVVGLGHKFANPESIVVSYQGDGDLAAIGLAEIISTAQTGAPFTVIFVNNAIYGMTGGQLAPTTLMGQKTSTTPGGRTASEGQPLKVAELIAQLDGPVYVERVALYDAKQRIKAARAIRKALQIQADRKGFAFVEVLAECPTHLGGTGQEASRWVKAQMEPVFPLGVKKDCSAEAVPWPLPSKPTFDPARVVEAIGGRAQAPQRFAKGLPATWKEGCSLKFAGSGGDGAQTTAALVTQAALQEGCDAVLIPSYGPESRGGTSFADVHLADAEASPAPPHLVVAFNAPSVAKFLPLLSTGGTLVYDSSIVTDRPAAGPGVRVYGVPFSTLAKEAGSIVVKSVVALGALQAATGLFPSETFLVVLVDSLKKKPDLLPVNRAAFQKGREAVLAARTSS